MKLLIFLLFTLSFGTIWGQDINSTAKRLETIQKQIRDYERKIEAAESEEKINLQLINEYDRKVKLIDAYIKTLTVQLSEIKSQIVKTSKDIEKTKKDVKSLKAHYADYVTSIYKKGVDYEMELIFSSQNINQSIYRIEYMKFFSEQRKRDMNNLLAKQRQMNRQQKVLDLQLVEQEKIIVTRQKEEKSLLVQKDKMRRVVDKLQKNKKQFAQSITDQRKEEERLQNLISKLIEAEEARRAAEAAKNAKNAGSFKKSADYNAEVVNWDVVNPNFANNKGKFFWPVSNGVIINGYGKIYNKELKTTMVSNGIDIAVPVGSDVRVIADGVIAKIDFLPGFEHVVIVRHNANYLTVYSMIAQVTIREGETVSAGKVIGTSGGQYSSKGPSIHFELWKGKDHQNPEVWLARQ